MVFVKPDEPGQGDSTATAPASASAASRDFHIAHLSDLHLFDPPHMMLRDFMSKRVLGYLSWRLHRQSQHRTDFMPALCRALGTAEVDHIVVTGDLTHLGHEVDFDKAGHILQQLGGPDRITLVPGNHDAYVEKPWCRKTFGLMPYLRSDPCAADRTPSAPDAHPLPSWPSYRIRNGIAIIGVSSAGPTRPFSATGNIGREQREKLKSILIRAADQALFRLLLIHHPPVFGLVGRRRHLTDHGALADIIGQTGAELLLHGHAHRFSEATIEGPCGKIAVVGVPALTALSAKSNRRAGFHLYRIRRDGGNWQVAMTAYRYCLSQNAFAPAAPRMLPIPPARKTHGA
jgi:3',5'-cyclic AMP phosphodiesterase CpdA